MKTRSGFHIAPGTSSSDAVRAVCDAMAQVEFETPAGTTIGQIEMQVKDIGDGLFKVSLIWAGSPIWDKRAPTQICTVVVDPEKQRFLGPCHYLWTPFGPNVTEEKK